MCKENRKESYFSLEEGVAKEGKVNIQAMFWRTRGGHQTGKMGGVEMGDIVPNR